jgi:hypothetical protein
MFYPNLVTRSPSVCTYGWTTSAIPIYTELYTCILRTCASSKWHYCFALLVNHNRRMKQHNKLWCVTIVSFTDSPTHSHTASPVFLSCAHDLPSFATILAYTRPELWPFWIWLLICMWICVSLPIVVDVWSMEFRIETGNNNYKDCRKSTGEELWMSRKCVGWGVGMVSQR